MAKNACGTALVAGRLYIVNYMNLSFIRFNLHTVLLSTEHLYFSLESNCHLFINALLDFLSSCMFWRKSKVSSYHCPMRTNDQRRSPFSHALTYRTVYGVLPPAWVCLMEKQPLWLKEVFWTKSQRVGMTHQMSSALVNATEFKRRTGAL